MAGVDGVVIVHPQGQMVFQLAQIVGLGPVPQPGQLQLKARFTVAQVHQFKGTVVGVLFPNGMKVKGVGVEPEAPLQVQNVEIEVVKAHGHKI